MGFALFALSRITRPLRHRSPAPAGHCRARATQHGHKVATPAQAISPPGPAAIAPAPTPRPLRVVLNRHDGGAFRLVICGRMADVCAELDRLALLH
ncbi:MAG: hypothetical protein OZ923_06005 [Comamonadaceae bacterium]|nr:hypothetical protein [Comamonadaceae bacterium]